MGRDEELLLNRLQQSHHHAEKSTSSYNIEDIRFHNGQAELLVNQFRANVFTSEDRPCSKVYCGWKNDGEL